MLFKVHSQGQVTSQADTQWYSELHRDQARLTENRLRHSLVLVTEVLNCGQGQHDPVLHSRLEWHACFQQALPREVLTTPVRCKA